MTLLALGALLLALGQDGEDGPKGEHLFGTLEPPRVRSLEDRICSFSWPCDQALRVARCESTMRPGAVSGGGHLGLFQIDPRFHSWRMAPGESLLDPDVNMRVAHSIWQVSGWRPWSCRP